MTDIDVEALLAAVGEDDPCGPDVRYDPDFQRLEELARGTPEREVDDRVIPAEEPRWEPVRDAAVALLSRSKDLQVASLLYKALLRTEGLAGAAEGLRLIRGLLDRYWTEVHPRADPADPEDLVERMNVLLSLADFDTSLRYLREMPLVRSRQLGTFSLRHHRLAAGKLKLPSDSSEELPQLARIEAALSEMPIEALESNVHLAREACDELDALVVILSERAGPQSAPELGPLKADLRDIRLLLEGQLALRVGDNSTLLHQTGSEGTNGSGSPTTSGDIRSRDDVVRVINRICEYYARNEPSSPVPVLLQRARRLVPMSFVDIVRDLTPAGLNELQTIAGLENDRE